jgi:hypothetical protein
MAAVARKLAVLLHRLRASGKASLLGSRLSKYFRVLRPIFVDIQQGITSGDANNRGKFPFCCGRFAPPTVR